MMDTSEEYINMCDCEEVREIWKKHDYAFDEDLGIFIEKEFRKMRWNISLTADKYYYIFLPHQDQIQERCKKKHLYYLLKDIQIFQVKHTKGCGIITMEQLWLAFYMHEKHGKTWDGEKWVTLKLLKQSCQ